MRDVSFLVCKKRRAGKGTGDKGEGIEKYRFVVTEWSRRCKTYSTGNIVGDIAITMYGAGWVLAIWLTTMLYP